MSFCWQQLLEFHHRPLWPKCPTCKSWSHGWVTTYVKRCVLDLSAIIGDRRSGCVQHSHAKEESTEPHIHCLPSVMRWSQVRTSYFILWKIRSWNVLDWAVCCHCGRFHEMSGRVSQAPPKATLLIACTCYHTGHLADPCG